MRTQAGRFRIENSVNLEFLDVVENLINPIDLLNYPKISATADDIEYIRNGRALKNKNLKHGSLVILIYNDNEICAVGIADNDVIKLKKVFL